VKKWLFFIFFKINVDVIIYSDNQLNVIKKSKLYFLIN